MQNVPGSQYFSIITDVLRDIVCPKLSIDFVTFDSFDRVLIMRIYVYENNYSRKRDFTKIGKMHLREYTFFQVAENVYVNKYVVIGSIIPTKMC